MKRLLTVLGFACVCSLLEGAAQQTFRIMEYNVENLFDCRHDSLKNDYEYLPGGTRGWSYTKFQRKLNAIAKVIFAASYEQVPDVVGLCEVENEYCMEGLVKYSPLREVGYRYVMTHSPDERGIDVALLYQPYTFRPFAVRSIRIPVKKGIEVRPTRDILHVAGRTVSSDTLDFFLCHMPSRRGGEKKSEPFRLWAATCLKEGVDSVLQLRQRPHIIIMGDFNDYPFSKAISEVLGASSPVPPISGDALYNLMAGHTPGTYRYKGEWGVLDHLIVSGTLLDGKGPLQTFPEKARILDFPFLLEEDKVYGGMKPFRTYYGFKYQGGYSDHLPVSVDLFILSQ